MAADDERGDDAERDYRAAKPRPTLDLRLLPVPERTSNARPFAIYFGAMVLAMLAAASMPFGQRPTAIVCFVILAAGLLVAAFDYALSRSRRLVLHLGHDEVVLETRSGARVARCRRDDLGVAPRHASAESWQFVTIELAIDRRRLSLGPAGAGYRWRVDTRPGPHAQYELEHAQWMALLEALDLTGRAEFPVPDE